MNRHDPLSALGSLQRIVGSTPAIAALRDQIRHLATFDTVGNPRVPTLLLEGETGTGKGLVARAIHDSGARASGPFVDVNCGAIPEHLLEAELFGFEAGAFTDARHAKPGLFEVASRGTLFLDEIDALPLGLQSKLLLCIEDKRVRRLGAVSEHAVDVKIVAAAQTPLSQRVADGRFRGDLYHRLALVVLHIPPLRERSDDIVLLARYFLARYAEAHAVAPRRLTGAAEAWLRAYPWPGNVRELSHLMERVTLLLEDTLVDDAALDRLCLPRGMPSRGGAMATGAVKTASAEAAEIQAALTRTGGNVLKTARALGMSRNALRYRMVRYGIQRPPGGAPPNAYGSRGGQRQQPAATVDTGDQSPGVWEKKPVAVLAIELTFPKSAGLEGESHGPWTLATRWEEAIAEKVQGFGGMVLQRAPSLYTVVFGVPRALDHMPQRALHAALAVRNLVHGVPAPPGAEARPKVRLGVHLGEVLVGDQLLAVGDTLALPVRLLGLAAAGEIIVSAPVRRLAERAFALEPRELPGGARHPDRTAGYVVTGLLRHGTRTPSGDQTSGPFVGRSRERAELDRALEIAIQGRGQVVAIVGDAGVGKSRLCEEVAQSAARRECLVLRVVPLSLDQPHAFLPLIELLWRHTGIELHDDESGRRRKVTDRVLGLDPALEDTLPYLLALLGIPDPTAPLAQMDPQIRRQRTFGAVKRLVLRESLRQPVLLLVEDLHWLDDETRTFVDLLVESLPESRLLLLVTYRPDAQHRWGGKSYYSQVRLNPLAPDEAGALLAQLVPDAGGVAPLVLSKAQGNPFFIEEIVQALVDQGVLLRGADGVLALDAAARSGQLTGFELPPTIQGVLAARMDRLPADERALLQALAVLGSGFSPRLVQRVVDRSEAEVGRFLARLQEVEFIHERPTVPEPTYVFKHALTQDVAVASLPAEQRRRLHRRAAQAIEVLFADRLEDHTSALADHYHRAGEPELAVEYLLRAGRLAVQRSAYAEAIGQFTTALGLLAARPSTRERNQRELELQTALGAALMATRGLGSPDVEPCFTRARELAREAGETPELFKVLQGLAVFYALRVQFGAVEEMVEERRRLAERFEYPALLLQAHIARGHLRLALGQVTAARTELERGMALYDPAQHHALALGAGLDPSGRDHGALVLWLLGYPDQAQASLQGALALAEGRAHPFDVTVAQIFAAMLHQFRREATLTRERAEAAITLARRHGFAMWEAMGMLLSGWAVAIEGKGTDGVLRLRQGIDGWRATGAELLRPYFLGLLAEALASVGNVGEALVALTEALETVTRTGERWWGAELQRLRGDLLVAQCGMDDERSEGCLREALQVAEHQGARSLELRAATSLARLLRAQGRREQARAALDPVVAWFTEGRDTEDLKEAGLVLAQLSGVESR